MNLDDLVWSLHCMGLAPSQVAKAVRDEHPQADAEYCRRTVSDRWLEDTMAHARMEVR